MVTRWFTSDTHYYHNNIIRYCNRPFDNVTDMNETLIHNYNDMVGDNDEVYHLGDFGFAEPGKLLEVVKRLKGKKYLNLISKEYGPANTLAQFCLECRHQ